MKKINCSSAPDSFTLLINGDHRPVSWDSFRTDHHEIYREIRDILLTDQHMTSGYTELPLEYEGNVHIDHFKKKGLFGSDELFHWENFIVDEQNNKYGAGFKDSIVHTKDIYDKIISPVLDSPEHYLGYMEDGSIIPLRTLTDEKDISKARTTIEVFNLNHPYLKKKRFDLMMAFTSFKEGGLSKEDVYQSMQKSGFFSVIDYIFK